MKLNLISDISIGKQFFLILFKQNYCLLAFSRQRLLFGDKWQQSSANHQHYFLWPCWHQPTLPFSFHGLDVCSQRTTKFELSLYRTSFSTVLSLWPRNSRFRYLPFMKNRLLHYSQSLTFLTLACMYFWWSSLALLLSGWKMLILWLVRLNYIIVVVFFTSGIYLPTKTYMIKKKFSLGIPTRVHASKNKNCLVPWPLST